MHGIPEDRNPPDYTIVTTNNTAMNRIGTALAYLVACALCVLGFLGFLLIVSDTDHPTMPAVSTSEFLIKKIAGVLILGITVYTWRSIERYGRQH